MIPYPKNQPVSVIKAIDELNKKLTFLINENSEMSLVSFFFLTYYEPHQVSLNVGDQVISYSKYFHDEIYDALFALGYQIPFSKTFFKSEYILSFDIPNKIVIFDQDAVIKILNTQRMPKEKEMFLLSCCNENNRGKVKPPKKVTSVFYNPFSEN